MEIAALQSVCHYFQVHKLFYMEEHVSGNGVWCKMSKITPILDCIDPSLRILLIAKKSKKVKVLRLLYSDSSSIIEVDNEEQILSEFSSQTLHFMLGFMKLQSRHIGHIVYGLCISDI